MLGSGVLHENPENIERGLTPPSGLSSGARFFGRDGSGTPSATTSWDSLSDGGVMKNARQSGLATPVSRSGDRLSDAMTTSIGGDTKKKWKLMSKLKFGGGRSVSEHGQMTSPASEKEIVGGSLGRHTTTHRKWWTFW
jgi:hypothetical protein